MPCLDFTGIYESFEGVMKLQQKNCAKIDRAFKSADGEITYDTIFTDGKMSKLKANSDLNVFATNNSESLIIRWSSLGASKRRYFQTVITLDGQKNIVGQTIRFTELGDQEIFGGILFNKRLQ
jgi:hypothetical protein